MCTLKFKKNAVSNKQLHLQVQWNENLLATSNARTLYISIFLNAQPCEMKRKQELTPRQQGLYNEDNNNANYVYCNIC